MTRLMADALSEWTRIQCVLLPFTGFLSPPECIDKFLGALFIGGSGGQPYGTSAPADCLQP